MEFNPESPFTNFQDFINHETETIESLFLVESEHMPSEKYIKNLKARDLHISLRRQAISSILKSSCKFDPFLSYLAVNYLDRFLYRLEMQQAKPWMLRLLAISCLSLAAKLRKIEFSLADFQGDGGLVFDTDDTANGVPNIGGSGMENALNHSLLFPLSFRYSVQAQRPTTKTSS